MTSLSRRGFVAGTLSALSTLQLRARTLSNFGVQLYTVRSIINEKPLEVLKAIEQMGYREAEVIGGNMDKIWDALKQTSLKPVSLHLDTSLFTRNQEKLPAALDDAKTKGFSYVVCPYIAPNDRGGVDVIKKLGETLNKAGERCKASGLALAYHNHAFEFAPGEGGGTLLDTLMTTTDPKLVSLEMDIMWVQVAGADPLALLKKYGKRTALMHLKNVDPAVEHRFNEGIPRTAFREVGAGKPDVGPVLKAAQSAGVKHFFVEQDQTPGDPLESLKKSAAYLKSLNY